MNTSQSALPRNTTQSSLTHPHTLYCSTPSPFTLCHKHYPNVGIMLFPDLSPDPVCHPRFAISRTHMHICLRHVPKLCLWQSFRKQGSVPLALRSLAAGHVTKGKTLWKQVFVSLPPIPAKKSACECVCVCACVKGKQGLSSESGGVMKACVCVRLC